MNKITNESNFCKNKNTKKYTMNLYIFNVLIRIQKYKIYNYLIKFKYLSIIIKLLLNYVKFKDFYLKKMNSFN